MHMLHSLHTETRYNFEWSNTMLRSCRILRIYFMASCRSHPRLSLWKWNRWKIWKRSLCHVNCFSMWITSCSAHSTIIDQMDKYYLERCCRNCINDIAHGRCCFLPIPHWLSWEPARSSKPNQNRLTIKHEQHWDCSTLPASDTTISKSNDIFKFFTVHGQAIN